ncbi:hypothetical protein B0H13DRAFT_2365197 [Mycena leptocephala]|nr:hypothetical protein B0H13DRAFT_2365197 [Mycena leptocephala]
MPVVGWQKVVLLVNGAVTLVSFSQQSILDHPPFLIYLYQFQAVLLGPCLSCPTTARVPSRRPQFSPSVSGLCNPHRCLCSALAARRMHATPTALIPAITPSSQILLDLGPRAPLTPLPPSPSLCTRLYWCMYFLLQVLPVVMHSCAIRSSPRAGTHALYFAPLAPYVRLPPLAVSISISISHSALLSPRAHHPSQ